MGPRVSQYPLSADIQSFVDSLDVENFRALSVGIGLGEPRPVKNRQAVLPSTPVFSGTAAAELVKEPNQRSDQDDVIPPVKNFPWQPVVSLEAPPASRVAPTPAARSVGMLMRTQMKLLALGVDAAIVVISAVMTTTLISFAMGGRDLWMRGIGGVFMAPPWSWIVRFSFVAILFGLYGVYVVYWLVFKILAGTTVGENWVGVAPRARRDAKQEANT